MGVGKVDITSIHSEAQKQFKLVDSGKVNHIISTGSMLLDRALSISGYPSGRIIEIYGPEQAGKTTLVLHAMAEAQKAGYIPALIDMERALDEKYAKKIGLQGEPNRDGGYIVEVPDYGEQAFRVIEYLITSGVKFIAVDSVSALVPKAELEGDYGESNMGLQARMMSQALRKLTGLVSEHDVVLIFINQIRMKIGVMFGNPETTSGGNALKFYSSIRLEIRPAGGEENTIKDGKELIGKYSRITVKKNKLGPPMRKLQIPIVFGIGIWKPAEIYDEALTIGLIERKSSNYYLDGELMASGKVKTIDWIADHLDLCEEKINAYKENHK